MIPVDGASKCTVTRGSGGATPGASPRARAGRDDRARKAHDPRALWCHPIGRSYPVKPCVWISRPGISAPLVAARRGEAGAPEPCQPDRRVDGVDPGTPAHAVRRKPILDQAILAGVVGRLDLRQVPLVVP